MAGTNETAHVDDVQVPGFENVADDGIRCTFETERTNVESAMEDRNKETDLPEREEYATPGSNITV